MTQPAPDNPFVRYRERLDSYAAARASGWSDADFVAVVERLDDQVRIVEGHGFVVTPCREVPTLADAVGIEVPLHVKDDTGNVGGSHKARHLFGVMLHHAVAADASDGELAIASCGNAAVAAATVARAVDRPLRVFIPTWADPAVVRTLEALDARIEVAERRSGESGDPTYLRFTEAVARGAVPFSVQGTSTPTTLDGGRTIGWELAEQVPDDGAARLLVQVGGGALASAAWAGMAVRQHIVHLHAVQTQSCAPLARAWRLVTDDLGSRLGSNLPTPEFPRATTLIGRGSEARRLMSDHPDRYMWPWEPVTQSAATGILDDVTYDWQTVIAPMVETGGWPVVVDERAIEEANRLGRAHTGIDVDHTGTAGLAALLAGDPAVRIPSDGRIVVLFTGVRRS